MAKLLIVAVLLIVGSMATVTDAQAATCAQKLVSCYPYLNNATAKPQNDCCNPIREAVANDLPCLCNLYNDPNLLPSLNVSVSEALRISRECGVPTNLSNCNSTSTTTAPPPPGQPGGKDGGADRIALTGVTILFLFLVSIALY